jgi:hypothetical protein
MHETSIRKTFFIVDLGYEGLKCDSIGAADARATLANSAIIFKFTLKPSGENQHLDEDYLHGHPLDYVQVTETQVLDGVRRYVALHSDVKKMHMEIYSKGRQLRFHVKSIDPQDASLFQFNVERIIDPSISNSCGTEVKS